MNTRKNSSSSGRKSKYSITEGLEPGSIGIGNSVNAIVNVHNHDVLCGRGGNTNNHDGNERFRYLVKYNKERYCKSPRKDKYNVAKEIVETLRMLSPPARFLERSQHGFWQDIGDKKAIQKTCQALRDILPGSIEKEKNQGLQPSVKRARSMRAANFCDRLMPKRFTHAAAARTTATVSSCHAKSHFIPIAQKLISNDNPQQDQINSKPLCSAQPHTTMRFLFEKEDQREEGRESRTSLHPTTKLPINDGGGSPGYSDLSLLNALFFLPENSDRNIDIQKEQQIKRRSYKKSTFVPRNCLKITDLPANDVGRGKQHQVHQQCIALDDSDMCKYNYFDINSASFMDNTLDSASFSMININAPKINTESQVDVSMFGSFPGAKFKTPLCDKIFEYENVLYCPNLSDVIPYRCIMDLYI
eukprot:CAMPEP_0194359116 /NCGR_PEP_ID=MMETSP0174-20130528/6383_1 /TAXON_ID=216777 /ORGANISM="Proboscia alata, Strain PI-D3" /LENGTH=415 /DNA_ID=CAMNT_0039129845 /DNA_START=142 /DNA_END=1389 /DNA_ORIENTATION=-